MNDVIFVNGVAAVATWKCIGKGMHVFNVNGSRRVILTTARGTVGNNFDGWRTRNFWHVTVDGREIDTTHTLAAAKRIATNVIIAGGPDAFFAKREAHRVRVEALRVERERVARDQKIAMFERDAIDAIANMKSEGGAS